MRRRQGLLLFYFCAAIGALLLLAASLPQLSLRPGRSFILSGGPSTPEAPGAAPASLGELGYWRVLVTVIVLAMLAYFVIALIFSARFRRVLLQRMAQVLTAILLFYLLANLLAGMPSLPVATPAGDTRPPPQPITGEPLPAFVAQPSPWLAAIVSLILTALLLAGIWYYWRRGRPVANPLTALAQAAIEDIQAGGDVQSIVLRCYLDMNQVLGDQRGIARQRGMTAREFEQHLAQAGVSDEHIRQLTRLFEQARYSAEPPSLRDERAAVECLTAIVRAYGGPA